VAAHKVEKGKNPIRRVERGGRQRVHNPFRATGSHGTFRGWSYDRRSEKRIIENGDLDSVPAGTAYSRFVSPNLATTL
jgi:hypothetical protein